MVIKKCTSLITLDHSKAVVKGASSVLNVGESLTSHLPEVERPRKHRNQVSHSHISHPFAGGDYADYADYADHADYADYADYAKCADSAEYAESTKPNHQTKPPNQTYQTNPTKPKMPNQTYQT